MSFRTVSEARCFGGVQGVYAHRSDACSCDMTFGLYLPPAAEQEAVPALYFLGGLTCTHENAMVKAGAQRFAAEAGLALVFPDTSPRGPGVADAPDDIALGQGAGFYVNATQAPWAPHYGMWDYVTEELPRIVTAAFPVAGDRQSITGHSMGGHGALTAAMNLPERYASVSAFAPMCHPTASDWGAGQFEAYLGSDRSAWAMHDATLLMRERGFPGPMLIDAGTADPYARLLQPEALATAIAARRQAAVVRMHEGYDHSYFFVSTFVADHVRFHREALKGG